EGGRAGGARRGGRVDGGAEVVAAGQRHDHGGDARLAQARVEGAVVVVVAVDEARQAGGGQLAEVVVRARHARRQDDAGELVVGGGAVAGRALRVLAVEQACRLRLGEVVGAGAQVAAEVA